MPVGDWSLSINAAEVEYMEPVRIMMIESVIVGIIFFILGGIITAIDAYYNVKNIKGVANVMNLAAQGILTKRAFQRKYVTKGIRKGDEIDQMSTALNAMLDSLQNIVSTIQYASTELAASSQELSASSEENQSASEEIANCMTEVSQGSEKQVTYVEETNELFQTMRDHMNNSNEAAADMATKANEVKDLAAKGHSIITNTSDNMNAIKTTSKTTVSVMKKLTDRSLQIGDINEMISEIAEQTNLLALNAAIEAARAGEQGKGFAIVADEIRKLAAQSQDSAAGIQELILELQGDIKEAGSLIEEESAKVDEGMDSVSASEQAFIDIENNISGITDRIHDVVEAIDKTGESTLTVSSSMDDIVAIVQESAASSQEVSASSEELTAVSEEMASSAMSLANLADQLLSQVDQFVTE